ncbi:MAG: aminotransferase class V-fold PLP-dependent enzyme [Gammaproteobacteria bacterium]|nr:aminotransferase class V-fold PLP-dependent enzyme [Gammaproteobacteria bacterium]
MHDIMDVICHNAFNTATTIIQYLDENASTLTTVAYTIAATLTLQKSYEIYQNWNTKEIKKSFQNRLFQLLEQNSSTVKNKIDKEIYGILSEIQADTDDARSQWKPVVALPENGFSDDEILKRFEHLHDHYARGQLSGALYTQYEEGLLKVLLKIWSETALTNPMHTEWPLINLMEAELISMGQLLMRGESGWAGIVTHGGSTSILEACKAYVFAARERDIKNPEIIVPDTAHIAFDKAAKILKAKLIKVPVSSATGAADIVATRKAITESTCMLVGSAPSFPLGIMDPIEELGKLALEKHIPLHVDGCLGGFLTAFAKEAGFDIPSCDFSVPGVTSISMDTHKYGQTPKGTSLLLFNDKARVTTTHTHLDWTGGMYVTPSIDGSRSGADIALAWAVMCLKGKIKYIEDTKRILTLQRTLIAEIKKIDGIVVPYNPMLSVIPIQSAPGINALLIADRLKASNWSVNILQTSNQKPAGFHFCLTIVHANEKDFIQRFLKDLTDATEYAKLHFNEKPKGMAKAYGQLDIPSYLQERVGQGYIKILNTLPGLKTWFKPMPIKEKVVSQTALEENDPALLASLASDPGCVLM